MQNLVTIKINGESKTLKANSVLQGAVDLSGVKGPFAVAVNGVFISKTNYGSYSLSDGDDVEIVYPMQGG